MASFVLGNASGMSLGADYITAERPEHLHYQLMLLTVDLEIKPKYSGDSGTPVLSCFLLSWQPEAQVEGDNSFFLFTWTIRKHSWLFKYRSLLWS